MIEINDASVLMDWFSTCSQPVFLRSNTCCPSGRQRRNMINLSCVFLFSSFATIDDAVACLADFFLLWVDSFLTGIKEIPFIFERTGNGTVVQLISNEKDTSLTT